MSAKVVLLYMPWATTTRPSLALGILGNICKESRVEYRTFYPNLDMSARIGFEAAGRLANERALYGLSEHFFACDLFGRHALDSERFVDTLLKLDLPNPFKDGGFVKALRDEIVPAFLDEIEARVLDEAPTVVGFSATFNQVMGSLALAGRLKKRRPELVTLAGGACFDGEMGQEYHRALPHVLDHVFMGEAEEGFREFLRRHASGEPTLGIPGVTSVLDGVVHLVPGRPLANLSESPMPEYDSFFFEKARLEEQTGRVFNIEYLPFESSRGCWWGQKNHCVFCGINDGLMNFREKPVDRVIDEMVLLTSRYRVVNLTAADWIISRTSRNEIFRRLQELDLDLECFYETRADLSKEEVKLMSDAGVVKIQPGIESFSTELLRLMKKGTTRIRHVQFLRWCREYRIRLSYNILAGFPGEQAEWYVDMAAFLPQIVHLQPPLHNMHYVEMHRFSPIFERKQDFRVDEYKIRDDYAFNFPDGLIDPLKVGYFFAYKSSSLADRDRYAPQVKEAVGRWMDAHKANTPPRFDYAIGPGFVRLTDTRSAEASYLDLAGLYQDVFLLCDEIQSVDRLNQALAAVNPDAVAGGEVAHVVEDLVRQGVLMQEGHSVLALPVALRPRTTAELRSYVLGAAADTRQLATA